MFSFKICRNLFRFSIVERVSQQVLHFPVNCLTAKSTFEIRRSYSDGDNDKFVKSEKYKVFKDDESSIILDVEEERALLDSQPSEEDLDFDETDIFAGLNTSRKY